MWDDLRGFLLANDLEDKDCALALIEYLCEPIIGEARFERLFYSKQGTLRKNAWREQLAKGVEGVTRLRETEADPLNSARWLI